MAAVITAYTKENPTANTYKYTSAAATTADSVLMTGLDPHYPHCFLGVHMFTAAGDRITPAAGTFTVSVLTENTGDEVTATPDAGTFESPPVSSITASAPVTIDWQANTIGVQVTVLGLTATTTWKVVMTTNKT